METGTAIKKLSLDYSLFLFYRNPDLRIRIFVLHGYTAHVNRNYFVPEKL